MEYVADEMLILVPVLNVIGLLLKSTPKLPDWLIPYILLVMGIAFAISIAGFNTGSVIQGIIVAGVAVFGHQLVKQAIERE